MRGGRLGKATTGSKANEMKIETFTSQSKETYLEAKSVIVTVNTWANLEENHELIPTIKRGFGQPAANQS